MTLQNWLADGLTLIFLIITRSTLAISGHKLLRGHLRKSIERLHFLPDTGLFLQGGTRIRPLVFWFFLMLLFLSYLFTLIYCSLCFHRSFLLFWMTFIYTFSWPHMLFPVNANKKIDLLIQNIKNLS